MAAEAKKKRRARAGKTLDSDSAAVMKEIRRAAEAQHSILMPPVVTVQVVLPWTREMVLGKMKRSGAITSWKWVDREFSDGNKRRYEIVADGKGF